MYAAYHRDRRNQLTHHIGVPMIVFSVLVIASRLTLIDLSSGPLTLAAVLMSALLLFYILAAPLVGTAAVVLYGALLYFAEKIGGMGSATALTVFVGLFILGWVIQFVGHYFEGRKPALFDNLLQILMAPSFLIAEILFALGVEQGLKAEMQARMGVYLKKD